MPYVPVSAVVLLGMVGYFTGVVQTPLTASVIVMEMVDDQSMVFPIITTAFIALGVSKLICREPIYWALAEEFLAKKPEGGRRTRRPKQES
jgi:H+/Cl- antiporter ClcA